MNKLVPVMLAATAAGTVLRRLFAHGRQHSSRPDAVRSFAPGQRNAIGAGDV